MGWRAIAAVLLALDGSAPALAHAPVAGIGGFYGGLLHPLLVPPHLLALLALGLFAGQYGPQPRAALLAVFAAALVAGTAAIAAAFAASGVDDAILAAAALFGALAALARPVPLPAGTMLAAALGLAVMFDSVPQEISIRTTLLALAGTGIAAFLLPMFVAEAVARLRHDWQRTGVRVAGSWIAASAILVLALRLAR